MGTPADQYQPEEEAQEPTSPDFIEPETEEADALLDDPDSPVNSEPEQVDVTPPNPAASIDPRWVLAMIKQESGGNPLAVSSANAQGLMQIIPSTFKAYADPGDNPFNSDDSLKVGTRYFSALYNKYNDIPLSLAAYNAGEPAIDRYRKRTKYGTFSEVSALMEQDNSYSETRNYVPAIEKKYQKIVDAGTFASPSEHQFGVAGENSTFKQDLGAVIKDPRFNALNTVEKVQVLNDTYKAKNRSTSDLQDLQGASSILWEGASPEEIPNFNKIFTPPPVVEKGNDVNKTLDAWKESNKQKMIQQGVIPELFGTSVDTYLDAQANDERKAYEVRNRGVASWALNRAGNYVREGLKGLAGQITGAEAGAVRLFGGDKNYADRIQEMPEVWLGRPADDFLYKTDENGRIITNPDGTPQAHWQAQVAQSAGGIIGMIGGVGVGAAAGVAKGTLAAFDIGINSLNMAGGTFKTVYDKTEDPIKAYTSAFLTLPAAGLASLTQLGTAAGKFRPVLSGLSNFNAAKFIAKSTINNAAVNGLTGIGLDTYIQGVEIGFTGQKFDKERAAIAGAGGAIGGGVAGAVGDYLGARSSYLKTEAINKTATVEATNSLQDFQNDIAQEAVISTKAKYVPTDVAKGMGIRVEGLEGGGTKLVKTPTVVPTEDLPGLVNAIGNLPTPDDIIAFHKEYAALKEIPSRSPNQETRFNELNDILINNKLDWQNDNYVSNIKAYERALYEQLQMEPGSLPVTWIPTERVWEHVETGEGSPFVRDLLFPKQESAVLKDLSDISDVKIIREEDIAAKQEELVSQRDALLSEDATHENEVLAARQKAQESGKGFKENLKEREDFQKENQALQDEYAGLKDINEPKAPSQDATDRIKDYKKFLEANKVKQLKLKNAIDTVKTEKAKASNKEKLKALQIENRDLQAKSLELKKQSAAEQKAVSKYEADKKAFARKQEIEARLKELEPSLKSTIDSGKAHEENLKAINGLKTRAKARKEQIAELNRQIKAHEKLTGRFQKGLGSYKPSDKSLTLSKGTSDQVFAHELSHNLTEKLTLPDEVTKVLENKIQELKDKADVTTAKDLANEVILPDLQPKVDETILGKDLSKPSKKAIFDKDELLANQIGAILLKKAGKDIGNYKIIPELENYLQDNVKLPEPFKKSEVKEPIQDAEVEKIQRADIPEGDQVLSTTKKSTDKAPPKPPKDGGENTRLGGDDSAPPFNIYTGEEYETARSKTMGEEIPGRRPNMRRVANKALGEKNATEFIRNKSTEEVLNDLYGGKYDKWLPQRQVLVDVLRERASKEFEANPTSKEAQDNFFDIDNYSDTSLSAGMQASALSTRFRNTETFGDYIISIKRAMREGGIENTDLSNETLFALKELWSKAKKLPGVLQGDQLLAGFRKAIEEEGANFGKWFRNNRKLGMLSGFGTAGVNFVGGTWMSPFFTALSHPIYGRGLVWKTMWQTIPEAKANFKRVWESKSGEEFNAALIDQAQLHISSKNPYLSIIDRFGKIVSKVLKSTDDFNRTLGGAIDLNIQMYKDLVAKYPNDAAKFTAEAAKLLINPEDRSAAIKQAYSEAANAGVNISKADATVRAYEILREHVPPEMVKDAHDWAEVTSLKGPLSRGYLKWAMNTFFGEALWKNNPGLATVFDFIAPFGRAALRLGDYSLDFAPGNFLLRKGVEATTGYKHNFENPALQRRYERAQVVSHVMGAALFGLAQAGAIVITGEPEKILDRDQKDVKTGEKARSRAEFKEYEQKGEEPFSVTFKGTGLSFVYKDIPGLNGILFGLSKVQKDLAAGKEVPYAIGDYVYNALNASIPFVGINSLSGPYTKFIDKLTSGEATLDGLTEGLVDVLTQTAKSAIPAGGLLRDIKRAYDENPPETNVGKVQKFFSDIPGSELIFGSKPALTVFGKPVVKNGLDRVLGLGKLTVPGVGRFVEFEHKEQDPVIESLIKKGIAVPDVAKTIKFNKSDFSSATAQEKYVATREERLDKAYSSAFSPDEWYNFILATGPYIEKAAAEIAGSSLPTDKAQKLLVKRVDAIRDQAKKRYIRTGQF